jgi:D-glycero-beta-D-manno-heptose-7-phosphate kinase
MKSLARFINDFSKQRILVIGDLMVDKFVWGKVSRISPEAPVPVVEITKETYSFGGAGNVANNLISLGAKVDVLGVIGKDIVGQELEYDLKKRGINTTGIVFEDERPTIIKTRIIASHQQIVRFDKEVKGKFAADTERTLISRIADLVPRINAMIISDYGKGVVSKALLKKAIALALKFNIPVTVDPKIENFTYYKKVTCITPNLPEAIAGMKYRDVSTDEEVQALGKKILKKLDSETVLITRGEKGMTLFEKHGITKHIPTRAKEVFDVTGAGDTVISVFTLARSSKASFLEAAELSNFAAGIVVGKLGTATVTPQELRESLTKGNTKKLSGDPE